MATVLRVGARELKTRLGTYLDRVRRGERLIVTERHHPVAELRRIDAAPASRADRLRRLAVLGAVSAPVRRLASFTPVRVTGESVSATLLRDREDRL
jgi:prevent-host-death family protein